MMPKRFRLRLFIHRNIIQSLSGIIGYDEQIYFSYYDMERILKKKGLKNIQKWKIYLYPDSIFFKKFPFYVISDRDTCILLKNNVKESVEARYLYKLLLNVRFVEAKGIQFDDEYVFDVCSHTNYSGIIFRNWLHQLKENNLIEKKEIVKVG